MAIRYHLPTLADLRRLAEPRQRAITIYARTSPIVSERDGSFVTAKSAFDTACLRVRESEAPHAVETALREQWRAVAEDDEIWSRLSSSLAIFIEPDSSEVYVLPNQLETQLQVAAYFDLGQLVRAVTSRQQAYALTLSTDGWKLWEATAATRAAELELVGDHPADAAEATNRDTKDGRTRFNRLEGDERRKDLLERYAVRVGEAVDQELSRLDPHAEQPLFLFATDPLLSLYRATGARRQVVAVPGAPDDLRADQIDERIRRSLGDLNAQRTIARLESIGNDVSRGLVLTDLGDIARAAVAGAVESLVYDFTVDILGTLDDTDGEVHDDPDGYDLLSRIAALVLEHGGEAIPVRTDEVGSEEVPATVWNGTAVAHLRFPLA